MSGSYDPKRAMVAFEDEGCLLCRFSKLSGQLKPDDEELSVL